MTETTEQMEGDEISIAFLRRELSAAFERVWETAVCLPLESAVLEDVDIHTFPWFGAVAWIGGSWTGNVRLGLPRELAAIVAGKLLDIAIPSNDQMLDVLRELANMTAGNLKSALPGRCGLATPGNFVIRSLADVKDEFSPVMLRCYVSNQHPLVILMSALQHME